MILSNQVWFFSVQANVNCIIFSFWKDLCRKGLKKVYLGERIYISITFYAIEKFRKIKICRKEKSTILIFAKFCVGIINFFWVILKKTQIF